MYLRQHFELHQLHNCTKDSKNPTHEHLMGDVVKVGRHLKGGRQLQVGGSEVIDEVREDVNTQYYAFNFDYIHGVKKR